MTARHSARRRAGILVPLASIPSSRSWGIGEVGDIEILARWLRAAGQRILQLLPINEMPLGESSPYSALSAMAIDPQFLSIADVEDFAAIGGEAALEPALRARLEDVRRAPRIRYAEVRALKHAVLRRCFGRFLAVEWTRGTPRDVALRQFMAEQSWWLDEYAVFRALHARYDERAWTEWPVALRSREPASLDDARAELAEDILYRQYLQWLAGQQWRAARSVASGVELFGDLPFMVSADSVDVWTRQDEFRLDASVGVPPDAFSATGQDWGLPVYRWDVHAQRRFDWLRDRARRSADLYDGCRVDHLVGFYRTYFRPHDGGPPRFTPAGEEEQLALGERVLDVFVTNGPEIIAEDLGVVPEFVRASLMRLSVPGYKVFRWERQWHVNGQPFLDPADYPAVSVATSGTHDTEPLAVWWEQAPREEREAALAIPSVREQLGERDGNLVDAAGLPSPVHEAVLAVLCASGSDTLILPIQDVFGWPDRINQPATVADTNWTWRLPWRSDRLLEEAQACGAAERLREWCRRYGR